MKKEKLPMVRMEIACFLIIGMVAFMYFSAEKEGSELHRTFSILLIAVLIYLCFDGITVYTVNLSAQYISQLFKNEIGVNFLAYLTNMRMEKAKKLLISSSLSIGEISE